MSDGWSSQAAQERAFIDSVSSGRLHHAWLLTGPEGIGKASFARRAALWLLAHGEMEEADAPPPMPGLTLGGDGEGALPTSFDAAAHSHAATLAAAGTHPEFHLLMRQTKERSEDLARNITVAQVRELTQSLTGTTTIGRYRAVIIDALDDLERGAANALLKTLEEPLDNSVFFLISHAPGRILPTLRSRCRQLRFAPFPPTEMDRWLEDKRPSLSSEERRTIGLMSRGAPGRAMELADANVASLADAIQAILTGGDHDNKLRAEMAKSLALKAARPRYQAFLEMAPLLAAHHIQASSADHRGQALERWEKLRRIAEYAESQSYDVPMTVFEMGSLLADISHAR